MQLHYSHEACKIKIYFTKYKALYTYLYNHY